MCIKENIQKMLHIFHYPYGVGFEFIHIGNINVTEYDQQIVIEYSIAYHMTKKRIVKLSSLLVENCTTVPVRSISDHEASCLLYECLNSNLGNLFTNLSLWLKHHKQCRGKLIEVLVPLIKATWSIDEVKRQYIYQKWHLFGVPRVVLNEYTPEIVHMLDDILSDLLEAEANSRLVNKKAVVIQRIWRDVISNPYHPCCRRRLLREFNDITI